MTVRDIANAIIGMERLEDTEEAFEQLEHASGMIEEFAREKCEEQIVECAIVYEQKHVQGSIGMTSNKIRDTDLVI